MPKRSSDYWEKLSKIPLKNEVFSRKEELGIELAAFILQKKRRRTQLMFFLRSTAAVFLIILFSGIGYFSTEVTVRTELYTKEWVFPDGSGVKLQPNSEINYNRVQWLYSRHVKLIGSGRFCVKKGSDFIVSAKLADIQVLGTVFDVIEANDGEFLDVICIEGAVLVSSFNSDSETTLKPGESVKMVCDSVVFKPRLEEYYTYSATPLADIARDLERYFNCRVIAKPDVHNILFSGIIPTSNLNEALILLSKSCSVNYYIDHNTVYLYK